MTGLAVILIAAGLCGCTPGAAATNGQSSGVIALTMGFEEGELLRIGDTSASVAEFATYLADLRLSYEELYGPGLWDIETGGETLTRRAADEACSRLVRTKIMVRMADSEGITLSEEEKEKADGAADAWYATLSDEAIEELHGVTAEQARSMALELALTDALYRRLSAGIDPEVSDDEARRITVEEIRLSTMDEAQAVMDMMADGHSFEELMASVGGEGTGTYSFGQREREEEVVRVTFALDKDEISGIVATDEGYSIFKCVSTFNREETDENKRTIVMEARKEAFTEGYEAYAATQTVVRDNALWEQLAVSSAPREVTTSLHSFYRSAVSTQSE